MKELAYNLLPSKYFPAAKKRTSPTPKRSISDRWKSKSFQLGGISIASWDILEEGLLWTKWCSEGSDTEDGGQRFDHA